MTKTHLRGQLQTIKNNYALSQVGIALIAQPDALERFESTINTLRPHPEISSLEYIRYVFETGNSLKHATGEMRNSVLRNCLKEMFEIILAYGKTTSQEAILKAAPWYQFLRMVRNCISHDMTLRFNAHDLKQLPVTWSGLTIDTTMQNGPLQATGFLSRAKTLELMDEVIGYVDASVA